VGHQTRESESAVRLVKDAPEDAEEFGLRVNWQTEDERIGAAEFLIATRLQEAVRRRVLKVTLDLREQNRERFLTFVQQRNSD
jgi:hypothetical protein